MADTNGGNEFVELVLEAMKVRELRGEAREQQIARIKNSTTFQKFKDAMKEGVQP